MSDGELTFETQLKQLNIKGFVREYKFTKHRRWKFDFACPALMIAIEIEGGVWSKGRHTRPTGFIQDMEKYNYAAWMGWKVLRYSTEQINSGHAIFELEFRLQEGERNG